MAILFLSSTPQKPFLPVDGVTGLFLS